MNPVNTNALLNQLIAMHNRSLPAYLRYAAPAWQAGDEAAREVLRLVAEDQRDTAERLAALVTENGYFVDNGEFPMYYTGYHDLSFDFLLKQIIKEQKEDIKVMEQIVDRLNLVPMAKSLAEEALGASKGHLESLQEIGRAPLTVH